MSTAEKIALIDEYLSDPLITDKKWISMLLEYRDMLNKREDGKALFFERKPTDFYAKFEEG